jgi:hypothetical protein
MVYMMINDTVYLFDSYFSEKNKFPNGPLSFTVFVLSA